MDIITALTNYIETEYREVRINETTPSTNLLDALCAMVSVSSMFKFRATNILVRFIQDMEEVVKANFLASRQLSGEVYQLLGDVTIEWPDYIAVPDVETGLDEETILANRKLVYIEKINKLRDIKIDGGFDWNGHTYQSRQSDRENIIGSAVAAQLALAQGATVGNYRWANPDADFQWITADNTLVTLDAFDVLGLYATGIKFKTVLTFFARGMKDAILATETLDALSEIDIEADWPY